MNAAAAPASEACDVFVIGGGPAGATVAALLARRGWNVVVAEKERHPRFHIGESLLPLNLPLLEKLGVHDQIRDIAIFKYGAQFTSPQHQTPLTFNFGEAWDKAHPYSYEVRRAEFDKILFDNAIARGAQGFEETRVDSVDFGNREFVRIRTQQPDGTPRQWRSRFVVDASGRDTFIANKFGLKQKNRKHNSAAIYGHFAGAKRLP
ncbi:MAG: NAD(P)/FAD-dependent oxidoreductase, partial [Burkholderiales bacterium]